MKKSSAIDTVTRWKYELPKLYSAICKRPVTLTCHQLANQFDLNPREINRRIKIINDLGGNVLVDQHPTHTEFRCYNPINLGMLINDMLILARHECKK